MKVGIDISQMVYEGTGSGRYVERLVQGLRKTEEVSTNNEEQGVELCLFGSAMKRRGALDRFVGKGGETKFYPFPPKFFELIWNEWHVGDFEWFAGKVDVYHSSDWTQAPSKAKKVTTVHDLIPFLFPEYVHPRIRAAHEARWKWIVKEVDRVIVDAACTKRDILDRFKIDEDRVVVVVPLGVEERFLRIGAAKFGGVIPTEAGIHLETNNQVPHGRGPTANINNQRIINDQSSIFKKYNSENYKYVLSVGTLEPRKNIKRLVGAYVGLSNEIREEYPLVIVGKKAWAAELLIPEAVDVRFTGYVEEEDLPYLYGGAKLFVMPSLYEGFGLPVLEAMACGTPVLAANLSSLPEVGGDTIQYFEDVEKEEVVRKNLGEALVGYDERLVGLAYDRALGMTWQRTVEKTIEVYKGTFSS